MYVHMYINVYVKKNRRMVILACIINCIIIVVQSLSEWSASHRIHFVEMWEKMEKPHERIALTYSSIFVPFYKLLKYLGVFPYSFEFHAVPENHAGRRPLSRVIYARTEIWAILHKIVIIFYTTNSIYQVFQLIWNLIFPSSDSSALLILATWSLASVLGLMVALKYWKDGDSIVKWMTDMNTLESDIYGNTEMHTISY